MAEFDISEADAASQPASQLVSVDDDLIDYDSDVSLKISDTKRALEPGEPRSFDVGVTPSGTMPAGLDASDIAKATDDVGSASEALPLDAKSTAQEGNSSEDHAQEVSNTFADSGPTSASAVDSHVSVHEIDYDHEGLAFDANGGDESKTLPALVQDEFLSAVESQPPTKVVAETENESEHYEIDWEDDGAENTNATPGATSIEAIQPDPMDVNDVDFAVGDDTQGSILEGAEPADQDPSVTHESTAAQDTPASDIFPDITVVYRGQTYPMFADNSDGFFSNRSLIDETMKTVLDAFRAELELHKDLGPHDELVFQVDKLGLEFCEARILNLTNCSTANNIQSSPPETLAMTTLRQLLEILDILVKNEDFDSSRTLPTYLFTKPNAIKRFEFLVESATDRNESLKQVIYYFRSPFDVDDYDETDALGDNDEQFSNVEDDGNDDFADGGNEYAENRGSIEDEDAAYEYDDDGHIDQYEGDGGEEVIENHDAGFDDSTDNDTAVANDNDDRTEVLGRDDSSVGDDADEEEDLIDYADDETASNEVQGHVETSASAGTENLSSHEEEQESVDFSGAKTADDYTKAFPGSSDRLGSAANDDEDFIAYTDDKKSAADGIEINDRENGGRANETVEEGAHEALLVGHEDAGQSTIPHHATSEHNTNHVEDGVDLIDYSNGYEDNAAGEDAVSYNADDGDLIGNSSEAVGAGKGNIASHVGESRMSVEPVQETVAQVDVQADATGNVVNPTNRNQSNLLQAGARHSRNASDISITFSAADADEVLLAHAQIAKNSIPGPSLDESSSFDQKLSQDARTSESQHSTKGGITTPTESSTTATLNNADDAAMNPNLAAGEDELSEIDWREESVPIAGAGVEDAQYNAMKRAYPHEVDAQDGNDVKRRRS